MTALRDEISNSILALAKLIRSKGFDKTLLNSLDVGAVLKAAEGAALDSKASTFRRASELGGLATIAAIMCDMTPDYLTSIYERLPYFRDTELSYGEDR